MAARVARELNEGGLVAASAAGGSTGPAFRRIGRDEKFLLRESVLFSASGQSDVRAAHAVGSTRVFLRSGSTSTLLAIQLAHRHSTSTSFGIIIEANANLAVRFGTQLI